MFRLDGREVAPREYRGRLEVVVYSTDRLRVVRGSMRERRQYLDRQAASLWPSYRAELRGFERLLAQRNAALEPRARATRRLDGTLRRERGAAAPPPGAVRRRLNVALASGFRPAGESYEVRTAVRPASEEDGSRAA